MKYQDIHIKDLELKQQFAEAWMNGQYDEAFRILNDNPQLDTKKFVADCMAKIANSLIAIESYYDADFTSSLSLELDRFNRLINDFVYRKEWQNAIEYVVGNTITKDDKVYLCIKGNIGQEPPNETYWLLLNIKGLKGNHGINCKIKYNWNMSTNYFANDVVVYKGWLWFANTGNVGNEPKDTSYAWTRFLKLPKPRVYVSKNPPIEPEDGLIWVKII